ncbi:MAG: UTRA domain-containing protein [Gordonia sp. (in: high G+C Gram-positive bacteria)]
MSEVARRQVGSPRIARGVQDLISSLALEKIVGGQEQRPAGGVVQRVREQRVREQGVSEQGAREQSMVIVPFAQHTDHQTLVTDAQTSGDLQLCLIEHSLVASTPLIRAHMGMDDSTVSMLEQLGTLDDQPIFLRVSYHLAADFAPVSRRWRDRASGPVTAGMAGAFRMHFGVDLGSTESTVEVVRCDSRTAASLRVPVGSPMMLREMLLTDVDGVARELSFTHFRADRVALAD